MRAPTTADRHPRMFDAAVTVALMAACGLVMTGSTGATVTDTRPLDWLSVVVAPAPLLWRRRAPVAAFWAVAALKVLFDALDAGSPLAPLPPLVALHAVARYRPLRHLWPAVALILLTGLHARLTDEVPWSGFVAIAGIVAATALLGANQRIWRAYLGEVEERAARLERERDQQAALAVAAERSRIAREMHDIVAHHLTVMVALADGATATARTAPARAAGIMEQVSGTGRQALVEMRRLLGVLRGGGSVPPAGDPLSSPVAGTRPCAEHADTDDAHRLDGAGRSPQPGFADLDALVDRVRAAGLRVALTREGAPGPWGPGAGLAVHRILQEALTNTLKHAGPRATAEVRLRFGADRVDIEVDDDGAGRQARAAAPQDRHGLMGMAERAAAYDGHVTACPRTGAGWRVRAHLRFTRATS